ncbi:MAG TPA: radical SAM protein [Syntrophales bacterium]|nr:radical SAM protein [Syntrophales bacterium]HOX94936.1 radical SAM protein [Syntrophales bacterium]HPI58216.1 radical SAM protein [Syntrophales bacterium]HPN25582.1 radical SAM protein [Syntrophales bacterium]HQM28160.1 radical SAM protein [Syntrophales bacterium]
MVDVLLVNPRFNGRSELPPLGLLALASVLLKEDIGIEVIDLDLGTADAAERVLSESLTRKPRVLGVSAMTDSFQSALEICRRAKAADPAVLTVMGGVHATVLHDTLLRDHDVIDAVVRGEGEIAFPELVKRFLGGRDLGGIEGVTFRREGVIVCGKDRDLIRDLDALPVPAHHLVENGSYTTRNISSSRGCARQCAFCSIRALYRSRVRARGVESVVSEIETLIGLGAKRILFTDDNFTFSLPRVRDICNGILEGGFHKEVEFFAEGRVDDICRNPIIAGVMSNAGFRGLYVGAESGSEEILRYYRKDISPDDLLRAVSMCVEQNLTPVVNFILYGPMDTADTIRQTAALARKVFEMGAEIAYAEAIIPYVGTPLQEWLERDGKFRRAGDVYYFDSYRGMNIDSVLRLTSLSRRLARFVYRGDPLFGMRRVYYEMGFLGELLERLFPPAFEDVLQKLRGEGIHSDEAEELRVEVMRVVGGS